MQRVGRYEILGELGRGAMGVVLRAMDPVIGRTLAIKTIRFDAVSDSGDSEDQQRLRDRLFREARSAGMLSHPHIVTIYDIGQEGEVAYIAMEYVAGSTLDGLMRDSSRLDRQAVTNILAEAASALDYAHGRGIIHRDIKPGNVMITDAGSVKITDFGVAKITSHQVTKTEMVLGTPSYMSPEQIEGARGIDGRSDQFSLAVLAYEMLSGEKPFHGESLPALLFKIARENAPGIHLVNPSLNESVNAVFRRAMAKPAHDRFPSCTEFVNALHEALIGCPAWSPLARGSATELPTMGAAITESTPVPGTGSGTGAPLPVAPPGTRSGTAEQQRSASLAAPVSSGAPASSGSTGAPPPAARSGTQDGEQFRASARSVESLEAGGGKTAGIAAGVVLLAAAGLAGAYFMGVEPVVHLARSSGIGATPAAPETPPPATPDPVAGAKPAASMPVAPPQPESTATAGTTPATASTSPPPAAPPAAPTPAPFRNDAPGPQSAVVDITSTPPGAKVTFDDTQESCVTPCAKELPAGRHVLRYSLEGHRPGVSVILVPQETKASARLDAAAGTLLLISTPAGASVFVDGQPRGTTPASLKVGVGRHKVELKHPGLADHSREIDVADQQIVNIEVTWPGAQ